MDRFGCVLSPILLSIMPIDTLKSKRRLVEEYGLDDRQAEGIVELIAQSQERGATASDVEAARRELSLQMEALEDQLEAKIEALEDRLEAKIETKIKASEERTGQKIERLHAEMGQLRAEIEQIRTEMAQQGRQTLQWMIGIAAFITVLLTLFEYVL